LVVVVDDDESLRQSVENLLGSVGVITEGFESAEAFLSSDALAETACLVLDLRLNGRSGLDLMAVLVDAGRTVPVVMLTAHGDREARQRAVRLGAIAFLAKPFRAAELLEAVTGALKGR
jgi:FixJ family two-component response regulator